VAGDLPVVEPIGPQGLPGAAPREGVLLCQAVLAPCKGAAGGARRAEQAALGGAGAAEEESGGGRGPPRAGGTVRVSM